jgi:exopolysaccharide transport family protein
MGHTQPKTSTWEMNMEEFEEKQIDLREYLRILIKRRWVILVVFALVVLAAAITTFTATPIFQATAQIIIEKENPNLVSIEEVMAVDSTGTDYYQTQYKIIESRSVAREVIRRLDLEHSWEFFPPPKDNFLGRITSEIHTMVRDAQAWIKALLKTGEETDKSGATDEEAFFDSELVSEFIERIRVEPIENSRLVNVSVEAKDPVMAARMANELVKAYIDQNLETKLTATKDAAKWLSNRIDDERKKVEAAEKALLRYKEENQIITDFSSDAENITAQKLAELNTQLVEAESRRVEAETRYRQAISLENTPDMLDSIPEVLSNDLVKEIKKMEVTLFSRMSELSKKYGRNHPQMQAINSELVDLKKRKKVEARRVVNSLKNEYKLALAREESLKKALARQKSASLELNKKAVQYGVLQREAESSRHMYEMLIKRFKETSLTEEMKTGNVRIIDKAEIPRFPAKPNKKRNLLLAIIMGLFLGVGLALFLEHLDNTIKMPDEIKDALKIPYLGLIPAFAQNGVPEVGPEKLVAIHSPKSVVTESYRSISTGILFSSADNPPQVIMVTSAIPLEGKTTSAANLASCMANAETRVLLVDCDMRRPKVHKFFDIDRNIGLSSILVGTNDISDAIVASPVDGLDILPAGPIPPNPAEIVGSKKMVQLINTLKQKYGRIIIDSPPVSSVTDAVALAQTVNSVLLVIRAGETPRPVIENSMEQLQRVNANILGAILNGVDVSRGGYNYYQYSYNYYGEDEDKKNRQKHAHRSLKEKRRKTLLHARN